jgi:hypothetical protein
MATRGKALEERAQAPSEFLLERFDVKTIWSSSAITAGSGSAGTVPDVATAFCLRGGGTAGSTTAETAKLRNRNEKAAYRGAC